MATEKLDSLMQAAERDPALAGALTAARSLDELVRIGTEHGHDFTRDELDAYLRAVSSGELREDELDAVSGGAQPECYLKYELSRTFVKSYSV